MCICLYIVASRNNFKPEWNGKKMMERYHISVISKIVTGRDAVNDRKLQ